MNTLMNMFMLLITHDTRQVYHIGRPQTTIKIGNVELPVMIDSGASVNVMDKKDFEKLIKKNLTSYHKEQP